MTKCTSIWGSIYQWTSFLLPPPQLNPQLLLSATQSWHTILPKSGLPQAQWPKPRVPSSEWTTECSLLSAGGAQSLPMHLPTASVQERYRQRGCSSPVLWGISFSPGEINKEEKPILPIHPQLKHVPAKPQISKPFSRERHHNHYRKQHPEAAGDPCPVPTSQNKSTPDTVCFKLLPQKWPKWLYELVMVAQCLFRISMCFTQCLFSLPKHSMQSIPGLRPGDLRLSQNTIPEMNSCKGSLFGKASFVQGYHLLISAEEKEHHYPH